jgi:hypothetical protein
MNRIYKYGTGDLVPDDAVYVTTVTQTHTEHGEPCFVVWHYFLVFVPEK